MSMNVLLVGHCGPDAFMLKSTVERALPGAAVTMVNDAKGLEAHDGVLLLVNRVLDGRFATQNGVELIGQMNGAGAKTPMILVSNFADAQADAEAAGARPGFGKNDLFDSATTEKIQSAVA